MKKVKQIRFLETTRETMSYMVLGDIIIWFLELLDNDNERFISRIPASTYKVKRRHSEKHEWHYQIMNVRDRDWILIHAGNFYINTKGCQLPGKAIEDINFDGEPDVKYSRAALDFMLVELGDEFELEIIDRF